MTCFLSGQHTAGMSDVIPYHTYAYALIAKCHNTIKQLIAMAVHVP